MIATLEKQVAGLTGQLERERAVSGQLQQRLASTEAELANMRSLTAELRAGLRHGLTGLEAAAVPAGKLELPQLGEQTRLILGLAGEKSDTEDSAYEDPNTESLKSRPKSSQAATVQTAAPVLLAAPVTAPPAGRPAPRPRPHYCRPAQPGPLRARTPPRSLSQLNPARRRESWRRQPRLPRIASGHVGNCVSCGWGG